MNTDYTYIRGIKTLHRNLFIELLYTIKLFHFMVGCVLAGCFLPLRTVKAVVTHNLFNDFSYSRILSITSNMIILEQLKKGSTILCTFSETI